jgi:hypothetical protein
MSNQPLTFLGASNPLVGMNSSIGAEFIGANMAQLLDNLRVQNGYAVARNGYGNALIAAIDANASYRRHYTATIGTTPYLFVAVRLSGTTRVYYTSSFSSWTEATDATTRLATDGDVGFALIPLNRNDAATDTSETQAVIFGNGTDNNRLFYFGSPNVCTILADPSFPSIAYQEPVPAFEHYFASSSLKVEAMSDATNWNIANTSGIVTNASTTGAQFNLDSSVASGQTLVLLFNQAYRNDVEPPNNVRTAVGSLTLQKEVGMLWTTNRTGSQLFSFGLNNTGVNVADYLSKIEALCLADGATAKPITGAANNGSGLVRITAVGHGYSTGDFVSQAGILGTTEANGTWEITVITANTYDLNLSTFTNAYISGGNAYKLSYYSLWDASNDADPIAVAVKKGDTGSNNGIVYYYPTGTLEGLTFCSGYRFTCQAPPVDCSNFLIGSFTTGQVDTQALYAVSFGLNASFAEGYAAPCEKRTRSFRGGPNGFNGKLYTYAPPSGVSTQFWVYSNGTSSANVRDILYYYRSDPETSQDGITSLGSFYYIGNNGTQSLSASLISGTLNIKDDNTPTASRVTARVAYDETHLQVPSGGMFLYVNDRLYVSGVAASGNQSQLWVSADRDPLDFSRTVRADDFGNLQSRSPVFRSFSSERVTALAALNTAILGVDSILLWTDRRVYRLGGFNAADLSQASIVGDKGTIYPNTIALYDNAAYYLDAEGQVRAVNGASLSSPLSYRVVDNQLQNGTITAACAYAGFQRYQVFYRNSSSGSGNDRALLWDADTGGWCRDSYGIDIRGSVVVGASPRRRIFVITEAGALYEWDKPGVTTDAGSNITITLTSRILGTPWQRLRLGKVGFVTDDLNSGTMTITRNFRGENNPDGTNTPATSSLSLDSSFSTAWRVDTISGGTGVPGASGYGPSVSCSAIVPGGFKIYEGNVEVSPGPKGAGV